MNKVTTKNSHIMKARHRDAEGSGYGKHILRTIVKEGREYQYHATKGWRNYRWIGDEK